VTGRDNSPDFPEIPPSCTELDFEAVLVNPDLALAARVRVGDKLGIHLADGMYPSAYLGDERVGGIASGFPGRLAECIRTDGPFEATVIKVDGGTVMVRVRHS